MKLPISIHELEENLLRLPGQIREAEVKVVACDNAVEKAKLEYDVCFGMTLIGSKAPNATEKKAMSVVGSQLEAENLIEAKYNLKKAQLELSYLNNKWISLRKISSLEQEQMRSQISGN